MLDYVMLNFFVIKVPLMKLNFITRHCLNRQHKVTDQSCFPPGKMQHMICKKTLLTANRV